MGENHSPGLSRHGFSHASIHRVQLCLLFPSHTENTDVETIPWSSKESCLNFLTSVSPAGHQGFRAARNPVVQVGCLLSPQWLLKKVWEKGVVEK